MEATHAHTAENTSVNVKATTPSWIARLDEAAEFNRYAIISVGFLIVGIIGGATAGLFAYQETWKLATVVGFSMLSVTLMLAVAPMKYITRSIIAALVVDLVISLMAFL